jgi:hypothetical protein
MISLDTGKSFIKSNWKYLLGLAVVLALFYFGRVEYKEWKQHYRSSSESQ